MVIEKRVFDIYDDKEIMEYALDNGKELQIKILSYGGIIRAINFQGENRVLGFDNIKSYVEGNSYIGAIIGPTAGRISNGAFEINGETYELSKNEGNTCLHGGCKGFSHKNWTLVEEIEEEKSVGIKLKYVKEDMENGFPGELEVYVVYTVDEENVLTIEYFAETNKETVVTFTNHSYFNLNNGFEESILNHNLKIESNKFIRLDRNSIPAEIVNVDKTPFDFRNSKKIGEDMNLSNNDLKFTKGYDHPMILNNNGGDVIELYSEDSKIKMAMETTEPVVILYCSNAIDEGIPISEGNLTFKYQGVCLETQWYPDALNHDFLEKKTLKPGENYYSRTKYKFSVER